MLFTLRQHMSTSTTASSETGRQALQRLLAENERDMAWLARKVNRSKSYIWRVVQGERPITAPLAEAFAELFGVSVQTFQGSE